MLALVDDLQGEGEEDGGDAEEGEDDHGDGEVGHVIDRMFTDDDSYVYGHDHQSDILHEIDDGVGRAQLFEGYDLRYARPHRAGHQREGNAEERHDDTGEESGVEEWQG